MSYNGLQIGVRFGTRSTIAEFITKVQWCIKLQFSSSARLMQKCRLAVRCFHIYYFPCEIFVCICKMSKWVFKHSLPVTLFMVGTGLFAARAVSAQLKTSWTSSTNKLITVVMPFALSGSSASNQPIVSCRWKISPSSSNSATWLLPWSFRETRKYIV